MAFALRHKQTWLLPAALAALAIPLAYLPLDLIAIATAATTGALVLVRAPWLIWPALGAALPFAAGVRIGPAAGSDLLLAAAIALWFADGTRRRHLPIVWYTPAILGALYVFFLLMATSTALQLGEAGKEVLKWTEFVLVLLLVPQMISARQTAWIVAGVLAGAIFQAALGLYQFVFQVGPEWFILMGRFMRASGSFHQPNPYAGYLGLILPVAVSLAIWAWEALWRRRRDAGRLRLGLVAAGTTGIALLLAAGLLASWSRGGWMGAGAGVATVLALRSRKSFAAALIGATAVLAAVLAGSFGNTGLPEPVAARVQDIPAYFGMTDVLNQPVTDENFSVVERVAHWVAALRMWEGAPWLGVGPGNYAVAYPDVRLPRWEDALGHAHNVYLNVLAESGLIGFVGYIALWGGTLIWVFRRRARTERPSWHDALTLGVAGVIVHLSVHNLVDNLFVQGMVILLGLWLATAKATAQNDEEFIN
jgi:putative inorganic carbon (HCO3(-)) transporter